MEPNTYLSEKNTPSGDKGKNIVVSPKPPAWYERIFRAFHLKKDSKLFLEIIAFLFFGVLIARATLTKQFFGIKAGTNTVRISVMPYQVDASINQISNLGNCGQPGCHHDDPGCL